jgi:predicted deacylase
MLCLPWSEVHLVEDRRQRAAMVDAMLAWNTDYHFAYIDIAGGGLLVGEAERQGKVAVGTELGGGGHVTAATHRLAARGLRNFLRQTGVLAGAVETRASLGLPPATILKALDAGDYVLAPESGLFEAVADLGAPVAAGQVLGRLHSLERPDRPPVEITSAGAGTLCTIRSIAPTRQGDCVAVIGHPCRREDLIA